MEVLIIDNYDSFTWNLFDYVYKSTNIKPKIIHNDSFRNWNELTKALRFDAIIVSPGPGTPCNPKDLGISADALMQDEYPVLGVCLGMQALWHLYGGTITKAPQPCHGQASGVYFENTQDLFNEIPNGFNAGRYHSLMISQKDKTPSCLEIIAWTQCNVPMAIRHKDKKKWGVQFHPESILTEKGQNIINNFLRISRSTKKYKLTYEKIDYIDPIKVFTQLYSKKENCFWLDSQNPNDSINRFSFMGFVACSQIHKLRIKNKASQKRGRDHLRKLESILNEYANIHVPSDLPFNFCGGLVGYFTYEMKNIFSDKVVHNNNYDDSYWLQVDNFLAFDHKEQQLYVVAITETKSQDLAHNQIATILKRLKNLKPSADIKKVSTKHEATFANTTAKYKQIIDSCQEYIKRGESYEICLTQQFTQEIQADPLDIYLHLRAKNKANFGAFIKNKTHYILSCSPERFVQVHPTGQLIVKPIKGTCAKEATLLKDNMVKQKLRNSQKDKAENIMIVDLMRNDLTKVCDYSTIKVTKLNELETLESLHQLVSTVQGRLKPNKNLLDVVKALFPAGSITGAPKIRTMSIIDELEQQARGIYCGSIGYFSYNKTMDLSVAIRTAYYHNNKLTSGAGGAVTFLSDTNSEYTEMLLKSQVMTI